MINFMKLFVMCVVFIQIQTAFSIPNQTPPGPNLIQQLYKRNRYQSLCVTTLNLDPRSKSSNIQGLAEISIDATTKKMKESLNYLLTVFKDIVRREEFERYGTCIEEYGGAVEWFLPAALADFKAKRYFQTMSNMKHVVSAPDICEEQFAGELPFPLTGRNKAVHDIAYMTAGIIKTLVN